MAGGSAVAAGPDSAARPRAALSTLMFYVPWRAIRVLGPAYYLYFRSFTNQDFSWWRLDWHLLPGVLE